MKNKICIIVSNFYPEISKKLIVGATSKLNKKNYKNYKIKKVQGTFEIPYTLSNCINKYDAFIVLGCVIRGQTSHFDFLCSSVFQSILSLSTKFKKPKGNGIITCENKKQALKRADSRKSDHGGAAAMAAIGLLKILK